MSWAEAVRFKTGTPPRVNKLTVDTDKMEIQPGDDEPRAFSYETTEYNTDQLPCWLTYTNEKPMSLSGTISIGHRCIPV